MSLLAALATHLPARAQQPNAIGTAVVSGSYQAQALTTKGGGSFKQYQVQASSGRNREWNSMVGTGNFSSNWQPYDNASNTLLAGFNRFINPGPLQRRQRQAGLPTGRNGHPLLHLQHHEQYGRQQRHGRDGNYLHGFYQQPVGAQSGPAYGQPASTSRTALPSRKAT